MVARRRLIGPLSAVVILFSVTAQGAEPRPIEIIEDNSFLLEEAYNQEPGVVQQIVAGAGVPIGLNRQANNLAAFLYFSIEHKLF